MKEITRYVQEGKSRLKGDLVIKKNKKGRKVVRIDWETVLFVNLDGAFKN